MKSNVWKRKFLRKRNEKVIVRKCAGKRRVFFSTDNTKTVKSIKQIQKFSFQCSTESSSILVLFCRTIWCTVTESVTITVLVLKAATVIFPAGFLFNLKLYSGSLFFWSWFWSVLRFLPSTFFHWFLVSCFCHKYSLFLTL